MNALYILQIMSTTVDLPELDFHNLVNTGGIAFLIWYIKKTIDRIDNIDAHMNKQDIQIGKIETEIRVRNEKKD